MAESVYKKDSVKVAPNSKLYVFSDGVYEVRKGDGKIMSLDEFAAQLPAPAESGASKVESMMRFSKCAQNSESFEDDFSLCEVVFK